MGWAEQIAVISKVYADKGDYVAAAGDAAGQLYGYGNCDVLFKPTKSTKNPFRPTGESAMSYFVGSEAMKDATYTGEDACLRTPSLTLPLTLTLTLTLTL